MSRLVQVLNPITDRWVKIDTQLGCIVGHKKSLGPYKGIKIAEKKHDTGHTRT